MKSIKGKYGEAKIFTELVEIAALDQIATMLNQEFTRDSKIRIMPDVHSGAGCVIGTTMTIKDEVCPNLVGVDIGCGMLCVKIDDNKIDLAKLDNIIREKIPSGFNIRSVPHSYINMVNFPELYCFNNIDVVRAYCSIGTLGGGNHFIEIDKDELTGELYLIIHTGSRHLGVEVANYYQDLAYKSAKESINDRRRSIIASLKESGREQDISIHLKNLTDREMNKDLTTCKGIIFLQYIHDMKIVQKYASINRYAIFTEIFNNMGWTIRENYGDMHFETVHNYIDTESMILRKGAVSARNGERLLIPINMRDGSLICIGKGNPDWNFSAPHGAGRLMSRSEAKRTFSVCEFSESMKGIYTTSVNDRTLDECPMAYKPIDNITNNICDTVFINKIIKPIYNFKASE